MTQASRSHFLAAISIPRRTSSAVWASSSDCNLVSDAGSHGVIRLGHAGLPGIHLGAAACKIASGSGQLIGRRERDQPTRKVLQLLESHMELHLANPDFPPIVLEQATEVQVFAVVGVVRQVKRRGPHVRARGRKELLRQFNLAVMPAHFPLHAHYLLGGCMNSIVM